jgi:hypothetical protein
MKATKTMIGAALAALWLQAMPAAAEPADSLPVGTARSKNLVERTVTIDDQTFRVTAKTRIEDRSGRPMRLEQVRTAQEEGELVELDAVTYAYDAAGDVLELLKARPAPR